MKSDSVTITHTPVCFIQNKPTYSTKSDTQSVLDVIYQSSWSGDQNINAFSQSETEEHSRFHAKIGSIQVSTPLWCGVV